MCQLLRAVDTIPSKLSNEVIYNCRKQYAMMYVKKNLVLV